MCRFYRLEEQARSRRQRAMAISAATAAAEAVLRMNQNIFKPSTLTEENSAVAWRGM